MFKIVVLATALAAVSAQDYYSHGHGQATSSQNFVQHEVSHGEHGLGSYQQGGSNHGSLLQAAPVYHQSQQTLHTSPIQHSQETYHSIPTYHQQSHTSQPIYHQAAATYQQSAPVYQHSTPTYHQSSPVYQHSSPVVSIQHISPVVQHAAPVTYHQSPSHGYHQAESHQDYFAHPKYEFAYEVNDPHTGDIKSQHEHRDGDAVQGVYSLHEADGSVRTVEYNSDKHSGFNAYVKHSDHNKHIQPQHSNYHH